MKEISTLAMPPVSAVIITYNESANLRRTLSQLYWCDEVIIVDSFSNDGTDEIARENHCTLIRRSFTGFGDQKSFAVSQCKNDWILNLDADEYLTNELVEEILEEIIQPENIQAFAFRSNLVFRNQRFRSGRESNRLVVKLFNRHSCHVSSDRVHEKIIVKGRIQALENRLLHYSYRDITQFFTKFDRYTEWCAEKYFLRGKRKSKPVILISIPYYFLKYYLVDRNFLNGMNGFYWSALMAFYHFVKYIKIKDMEQADNTPVFETRKNLQIQFPLHKSNLLVTEQGKLFIYKKNGRI